MKTKKAAVGKLTVGWDLGDRNRHACVLDASGEIVAEEAIGNTREVVTAFSHPLSKDERDHGNGHAQPVGLMSGGRPRPTPAATT